MVPKAVRYDGLKVNRSVLILILFGLLTHVLAAIVAHQAGALELAAGSDSTSTEFGMMFFVYIISLSSLIAGLYMAYKRLSEKMQYYVRIALLGALPVAFFWSGLVEGEFVKVAQTFVVFLAIIGVLRILQSYDFYWVVHNTLGIWFGALCAFIVASFIDPQTAVALLLALVVWDIVAVDKIGVMGNLVGLSVYLRIPNFLIVPKSARIDMGDVAGWMASKDDEDKPDSTAGVIGVGDFALPGALTAALVLDGQFILAGGAIATLFISIPMMSATLDELDEGLPALVWLSTAPSLFALVGFASKIVLQFV